MFNIFQQKKYSTNDASLGVGGFTLIEVMVAVSIFAVVITVGIGSMMNVNKGYRQAQLQRKVIDNMSFVMESMVREIRIGGQYTIGPSPADPDNYQNASSSQFSFRSYDINDDGIFDDDDDVLYSRSIDTATSNGVVQMKIGNGSPVNLTPTNINVTKLHFTLEELDSSGNNPKQPYVNIFISADAGRGGQESSISMQTSVSQRRIIKPTP